MSSDRGMDKENVVHMEYYSAIKKTLPLAAIWMQLEIIILSEVKKTNMQLLIRGN